MKTIVIVGQPFIVNRRDIARRINKLRKSKMYNTPISESVKKKLLILTEKKQVILNQVWTKRRFTASPN